VPGRVTVGEGVLTVSERVTVADRSSRFTVGEVCVAGAGVRVTGCGRGKSDPRRIIGWPAPGLFPRVLGAGLVALVCVSGAAGRVGSTAGLVGWPVRADSTAGVRLACGLVTAGAASGSAVGVPRVPVAEAFGAGRLMVLRSARAEDGAEADGIARSAVGADGADAAETALLPLREISRRERCTIPGSSGRTWAVGR